MRYTRTVVSKKTSAGIGFFTIEAETGGKRAAQLAQPFKSFFATLVEGNLEFAVSSNTDGYFAAFFKPQCLDHCRWQADGQAVTPFGYAHD